MPPGPHLRPGPTPLAPASSQNQPAPPLPQPGTPAVAAPPKLRRNPRLVVASVAAICLGAAGATWAYTATANTHDVLAVRDSVRRGEVITREALMTVKIGVDPALHPMSADEAGAVVGKRAALDIPAGGIVTKAQVAESVTPGADQSIVGLSLSPSQVPDSELVAGDAVRLVAIPDSVDTAGFETTDEFEGTDEAQPTDEPGTITGTVISVRRDAMSEGTVVNVEVPHTDAPRAAQWAATGKVALVLDSRER